MSAPRVAIVERHGPQAPGEYWWLASAADGTILTSFWTEDRNPQELIDLAQAAVDDEENDPGY